MGAWREALARQGEERPGEELQGFAGLLGWARAVAEGSAGLLTRLATRGRVSGDIAPMPLAEAERLLGEELTARVMRDQPHSEGALRTSNGREALALLFT